MAEKKKQSPSFEQIMQMGEQRSIRSAVAMYTVKDLVVASKLPDCKTMEDFLAYVQVAYDALREISAGEATMKQKQHLEEQLRTSTIDHEERERLYNEIISPMFSWKDFQDMNVMLGSNQQSVLESPGNARQKDLHKELDKKEAREK